MAGAVERCAQTNEEKLSESFQRSCYLKKVAADAMAHLYKGLYTSENVSGWDEKRGSGFRSFCSHSWTYEWEGHAQWMYSGGHVSCYASIEAVLRVVNEEMTSAMVSSLLAKNPFVDEQTLQEHFRKPLDQALDRNLKEYVTAEKYYEPVMEDYYDYGKDGLEEECKKLGLEIVTFVCDGGDCGYEPDWY